MMSKKSFTSLTQEYFWFLLDEYGFVFYEKQNMFSNKKIRLYLSEFERTLLQIDIWLLTEPEFTRIDVDWLLKEKIHYDVFNKNLLEENFMYYADLIHRNAHVLINELELKSLLLLGLKRLFVNIARASIPSQQLSIIEYLNNLPSMDKKYYDYIKERDPKWDPTEELEKYFKR